MKRTILAAALLAVLLAPTPAFAHHGMVNDAPACGTYVAHLEEDYVKGRTDAMIYHVDHTVGCKRSILSGVVPAGIGEAQNNSWQRANCAPFGQDHAVRNFNYYWHETINPADVQVTCTA